MELLFLWPSTRQPVVYRPEQMEYQSCSWCFLEFNQRSWPHPDSLICSIFFWKVFKRALSPYFFKLKTSQIVQPTSSPSHISGARALKNAGSHLFHMPISSAHISPTYLRVEVNQKCKRSCHSSQETETNPVIWMKKIQYKELLTRKTINESKDPKL